MIARRCAWCDRWDSVVDRLLAWIGVPVSHGLCPRCEQTIEET